MDEKEKPKIKIFAKGEKTLRLTAKEVPLNEIKKEKISEIIEKMKQAIIQQKDALAVAAPQIGESWRITVISEWALHPDSEKPKEEFGFLVFINPTTTKLSQKKSKMPEGCLSVPGVYGEVLRSEKTKVEAYDENGKKFNRGYSGLMAQAIQHEVDHLNGILFVDKTEKTSNKIKDTGKKAYTS